MLESKTAYRRIPFPVTATIRRTENAPPSKGYLLSRHFVLQGLGCLRNDLRTAREFPFFHATGKHPRPCLLRRYVSGHRGVFPTGGPRRRFPLRHRAHAVRFLRYKLIFGIFLSLRAPFLPTGRGRRYSTGFILRAGSRVPELYRSP